MAEKKYYGAYLESGRHLKPRAYKKPAEKPPKKKPKPSVWEKLAKNAQKVMDKRDDTNRQIKKIKRGY